MKKISIFVFLPRETDGSTSFSAQHFNQQISINHHNREKENPADSSRPEEPKRGDVTPAVATAAAAADTSQKDFKYSSKLSVNLSMGGGGGNKAENPPNSDQNGGGQPVQNGASRQNGGGAPLVKVSDASHDVDSDETLTEERATSAARGEEGESRDGNL